MTYQEALDQSEMLKAHLNGAFSALEKAQIETLYGEVLGKQFKRTSCQRCYHDALIEIILYLRKEGKMKEKCNYSLRAGFIIHCPTFHNGKIYTNDNLTDEVAKAYLEAFPNQKPMFAKIPEKVANVADVVEEPKTIQVKIRKHKSKKK